MPHGTEEVPPGREIKGWNELRRMNRHRTSAPTDELGRRLRAAIELRRGRAPHIDAVLLAALELVQDDIGVLLMKVEEIEQRDHQQPVKVPKPPEDSTPGVE